MREACEGQAVRLGAKPLAHAFTFDQGAGGWGAAPLARSTPTRAPARDTPKNKPYFLCSDHPSSVRLNFGIMISHFYSHGDNFTNIQRGNNTINP
ncbi:MAG: hypothetical protein NZ455_05575 [Bacteroidia bacterium]|nr:hypothetical protein [Bacteroidia bacterium]MDW8348317.1 hypothetical protein [Bacteroidia bacterium]